MNLTPLPYRIGDIVRVIPSNDDTFKASCIGKIGHITKFNFGLACGETFPDDPLISVKFIAGGKEEFWREELELLTPVRSESAC